MKAALSLFFVFVFLSPQGLAHACLGSCAHEAQANQEGATTQDHSCCEEEKASSTEDSHGDCQLNQCMQLGSFDLSVPALLGEESKSQTHTFVAAVTANKLLKTKLASKTMALNQSARGPHPPDVPLYLFFQKLLLPDFSKNC